MKNITKTLKDRRLTLGMSQHDLAIHCGFTNRANISKLETHKIEWKFREVVKACEALDLKIEILVNTKTRHEEIFNAAKAVLEEFGGSKSFDLLPNIDRLHCMRQMVQEVVKRTGCHISSAKRNLAKALRRERYDIMQAR